MEAITREEQLMAAAAGLSENMPEPITRREKLLAAIAGRVADTVTVDTAAVGQTIVVKEIDENGKPTAWEAADFPKSGDWELITAIELTDSTVSTIREQFEHEYKKIFVTASWGADTPVTGGSSPYIRIWEGYNGSSNQQKMLEWGKNNTYTRLKILRERIGDRFTINTTLDGSTQTVNEWNYGKGIDGIKILTGDTSQYFFNPTTFYIYGVRA